jgi:K+-sensing histidine kinase KdpD
VAIGVVAFVTAVAWVIPTAHDPAVHRVVYVLTIATIGAYFGRGLAIASVVASLAATEFLFVEMAFSIQVAAFGNVVTPLVLLVMGVLTGNLAGQLRDREETARRFTKQEIRLREETVRVEVLRRADELRHGLLRAVSRDLRSPLAAGTLRDE